MAHLRSIYLFLARYAGAFRQRFLPKARGGAGAGQDVLCRWLNGFRTRRTHRRAFEIPCRTLFRGSLGVWHGVRVPSREWLEFEGGVIFSLFAQIESRLARRWRLRYENGSQKQRRTRRKERFFLRTIGSILWKLGCGPAFAASSRSSWKRNSTLRLGGTGMNGLGLPKPA